MENFATAQVPCMSCRGVQIPGTMLHGQLKFVWWCLVFVGPQCGTCFMSVMVPRIFRCLLGFFLKICVPLKWYIISWSSRKLCFLLPFSKPSSQPNYSEYYLVMAGFIFRSICKVAKSACWLCHVSTPAWDILALAGQIFMIFALFALLL
jgi:hypothetical protein